MAHPGLLGASYVVHRAGQRRFPIKHGRFPIKHGHVPINHGRFRPGDFGARPVVGALRPAIGPGAGGTRVTVVSCGICGIS